MQEKGRSGRTFVPTPGQGRVIAAGPGERLLVVAGPGTGKTEVAAQRLAELLRQGLTPAQILVLSFSRSAVGTLTRRLKHLELDDAAVLEDLRHLAIRTFDSWSFRMLRQSGMVAGELLSRSHDENIATATTLLRDRDQGIVSRLTGLRHVIVDEFQDLAGVRSLLVVELLSLLAEKTRSTGFTVLGDPAQAIYRFAARDQGFGDIDLWGELQRRVGGVTEVVLHQNHRATPELADAAARLRKILGGSDPPQQKLVAMQKFLGGLSQAANDDKLAPTWLSSLPEGSFALLTRTNAEALGVWRMLVGGQVEAPATPIRLRLAGQPSCIPPWVAGLLGRYRHPTISRQVFAAAYSRLSAEVGTAASRLGLPAADIAWARLAHASGAPDDASSLALEQLRDRLDWADSFPDDQEQRQAAVSITTIHQAKGMEFDNVAVLEGTDRHDESDPIEEASIGFVAVTRAGRSLSRLPATCIYKPPSPRQFKHGRSRQFSWGRMVNLQLGLAGDVDPTGFVDTDLHGSPQEVDTLQSLLLREGPDLCGRKVLLEQLPGRARDVRYAIRLQEQSGEGGLILGRTSAQVTYDLLDLLWGGGNALPIRIYNLRIGEIASLTSDVDMPDTVASPWRDSGLWLGVSLIGTGDFKTWKRRSHG